MKDLIDFFSKTEPFIGISDSVMQNLCNISKVVSIKKDFIMYKIGDRIDKTYFIKKGIIDIYFKSSFEKSLDIVDELGPGSILGEMELYENRPIIANCVARIDCDLISIENKDFLNFLLKNPKVNLKVTKIILGKWKNVEAGYNNLIIKLNEAQKLIEEQAKIKEKFVENIHHELRTPLTIIQGVVESLDVNDSKSISIDLDFYNKLKSSSNYLLDLINDLLDFSQLIQGVFRLSKVWIRINSKFEDILDNLSYLAFNKGISYNYNINADDSMLIYVDLKRIRQITSNLLSNAVKYTKNGSINVQIDCYSNTEENSTLSIRVKDTGIGISDKEKDLIFNKFYRIHNEFEGTGIGLSIVKSLTDLMEGSIVLNSKIGEGSEFIINIPVQFKILEEKMTDKESSYPSSLEFEQMNVLIIDDFSDTHEIIKALLRSYPIKIDSLLSGNNVLESISKFNYDIILLDLMMPDIDGYDILKTLLKYYSSKLKIKPKIIAFTALSSENELEKLEETGFDGRLLKPFTAKDLINTIYNKTN